VREGIYKVINVESYDKGRMVSQMVRCAWCNSNGFESCVCH